MDIDRHLFEGLFLFDPEFVLFVHDHQGQIVELGSQQGVGTHDHF